MSEIEFDFQFKTTHQVLIIVVVDTRILSCVAESLQEIRFASIRLTDYKDTEEYMSLGGPRDHGRSILIVVVGNLG